MAHLVYLLLLLVEGLIWTGMTKVTTDLRSSSNHKKDKTA